MVFKDLPTRVREASEKAVKEGWELTKQAMGTADQEAKDELTVRAEAAYKSSLHTVARGFLLNDDSLVPRHELRLEVIRTDINVFDLYRRVGRLEEARQLGESTLEEAVKTGDTPTTVRAGNFLTLVQSAEAYKLLEEGKLEDALRKYQEREASFGKMWDAGAANTEPKTVVMLSLNQAANYLDMTDLSLKLHPDDQSGIQHLVSQAEAAVYSAHRLLPYLSEQDRATWTANAFANLGKIATYRGETEGAIKHLTAALEASQAGSGYNVQIALIELMLANAHTKTVPPNLVEARTHFAPVEEYIQAGNKFGPYTAQYQPMIEQVREALKGE